jgi:hypothetical protein
MNQADFTGMAERIGKVLGKELGGRFNILANLHTEQDAKSGTRTIKIVDRWSDQDCTLRITRGTDAANHDKGGDD